MREAFVGNRFTHLYGIVNGTCNYILTRMKLEGADFATVLADAQRLGYAEAEPSLDIDGFDSGHKIGILASLAHGFWVKPGQIHIEGIRRISRLDIQFANQLGYTIKLLGIVKGDESCRISPAAPGNPRPRKSKIENRKSRIQVSVYPTLIPNTHVLASVNHVFNAVFIRGDIIGDTLFYGRGAGTDATASAVLSDVADAALDLKHGSESRVPAFVPPRMRRSRPAHWRSGISLLCAFQRGRPSRRPCQNLRHSWRPPTSAFPPSFNPKDTRAKAFHSSS